MKKFILAAACLLALGTNISAQNPEKKEPVKKECSKNDAKSCDKKDAKTCDKNDGKGLRPEGRQVRSGSRQEGLL